MFATSRASSYVAPILFSVSISSSLIYMFFTLFVTKMFFALFSAVFSVSRVTISVG